MNTTLAEIARTIGGEIHGDPRQPVRDAAPFEAAVQDVITVAAEASYLKKIHRVQAAAVIIPESALPQLSGQTTCNLLAVKNPRAAFARVLALFHPGPFPRSFISPQAVLGEQFQCGEKVFIASFVSVGDRVTMGNRVHLAPHVVIGDQVTLGDDVTIASNVTIHDGCCIGNRVTIQAGTVIGGDGFGYAPEGERYIKIPHIGKVRIDDDVEIGSLNAIDRGTFGETWIQRGVKTDNLVHIAHNVTIGENSVIVAQVGIAGSTRIGKHAVIAGQAGISGHLQVGDHVTIGPRAGILKSIPDGRIVSGTPEMPHRLWLKVLQIIPRLPEMFRKINMMEKKLNQISGDDNI
jgi:UDP-3-O-[3-hydroxymyristoyl] glucosamine N-acyltransferase